MPWNDLHLRWFYSNTCYIGWRYQAQFFQWICFFKNINLFFCEKTIMWNSSSKNLKKKTLLKYPSDKPNRWNAWHSSIKDVITYSYRDLAHQCIKAKNSHRWIISIDSISFILPYLKSIIENILWHKKVMWPADSIKNCSTKRHCCFEKIYYITSDIKTDLCTSFCFALYITLLFSDKKYDDGHQRPRMNDFYLY